MEAAEERATCRNCKQEIVGLGYHLRPIGTADELLGHLEDDAELTGAGLDPELGTALAEGWDSCVQCMATHAIETLSHEERVVLAEWIVHVIGKRPSAE
jgi:hypothetical protein